MEELDAFYAMFGDGHNNALARVIANPGALLGVVLTRDTFAYLYDVGKSTAGFPMLSPALVFALPTVAVNAIIGAFMSTMRSISYHYSIVASVCIAAAMIDGLARLSRQSHRFGMDRNAFAVGMTLLLIPGMVLGVGDIIRYGGGQGSSLVKEFLPHPDQKTLEKIVALVPPDASVAAPNVLMPDLSKREGLYTSDRFWRYGDRQVDYMIVDTRLDLLSDKDRNKPKYESVVAKVRGDARYRLVLRENGFEVYHLVAG
jgi:hypothetical protein